MLAGCEAATRGAVDRSRSRAPLRVAASRTHFAVAMKNRRDLNASEKFTHLAGSFAPENIVHAVECTDQD
jgi:hypothetical protein